MGRTPCSPSHRQNIRIDVHHHFFLDAQKKAKKNSEVGWRTPDGNLPWGPQTSLTAMDKLGIQTVILSPPPISSTSCGAENRVEVRNQNIYASQLCAAYPSRFGFFAGLPFLDDVEGTFSCEASFRVVDLTSCAKTGSLEEIAYSFEVLGADGVALISSYGDGNSASTAFELPRAANNDTMMP